jgi:hypothetical protein
MSLPGAILVLLASVAPTLQARFLGNAAFEISDGKTTLLTDFPYRSGAFGYMEYDAKELSARPQSVCLITHAHADHFEAGLVAQIGCRVVDASSAARGDIRLPGISIRPVQTEHAGIAHYSYLVEWKGLRLYFTGDTESTVELAKQGPLDALFITPWLLASARTAKALPETPRVVVYHHKAGEQVPAGPGCIVPRQGEVIEISLTAPSKAAS